jgi:hypothetical protein
MKLLHKINLLNKRSIIIWTILLIATVNETMGQVTQVDKLSDLSFGSFYCGSTGGTITISPDGTRTATGSVVLLGGTWSAARFNVKSNNANPITVSSFIQTSGTLTLNISNADLSVPTVINPAGTDFTLGGTLTVGNPAANPKGDYTISFDIIFSQ